MKTKRNFTVLIERDEAGYYVASVPALQGCHTQAKNLDRLMQRVREVIELCLEDRNGDVQELDLSRTPNLSVARPRKLHGQLFGNSVRGREKLKRI
jgi:predicted RNase H-like HicB family nuclease